MADAADTGWYSWVVVAACFVVNFMHLGVGLISGLFFLDIIFYYNVDRERAFTPFLARAVAKSISGPISGYLSHTLGYRFTIILGCFLASIGIFSSFFAQNILVLSVCWSIFGFGVGLSTNILPRVINQFSKKHPTKSNGIALCGSSIAGIILPFFIVALLNAYGMQGTFLITSAFMLNAIPGAILLRNPRSSKDSKSEKESKKDVLAEGEVVLKISKDSDEKSHETLQVLLLPCDNSEENRNIADNGRSSSTNQELIGSNNKTAPSKSSEPSDKSCPIKKAQHCLDAFSIFWDPVFLTFALPRSFNTFLYIIVTTIMVDFATDKGIEMHQATYLLMAHSLADLFGKLCLGWITDANHMSRIKYAALSYCTVAFACGLMVWANGFVVMTIAVILEAMGAATMLPTLFVLVSRYFDKERQSMVMASSGIFILPFCFGTAPLIGYFRDHLRSYDGLAYILSAISILCSVLILLIPSISRWKMKRKENTSDVDEKIVIIE